MVLNNGAVMSKSKGNVVDPDDMIQRYGADALRLYVMFVAPPEKEVEWTDSGLEGAFRFLGRVWRLVDHLGPVIRSAPAVEGLDLDPAERGLRRKTHATIGRVTSDLDPRVHLNTAVSALMELVNELYAFADQRGVRPVGREDEPPPRIDRRETAAVLREAIESLVLMLSPFSPHMCEELWESLGHEDGVVAAGWPAADESAAREEEIEIPVQVNGKVRDRITVPAEADEDAIRAEALRAPGVQPHIAGKQIAKVIVARGRLVSIVAK
jgi:leucyl-tRNA synthetase